MPPQERGFEQEVLQTRAHVFPDAYIRYLMRNLTFEICQRERGSKVEVERERESERERARSRNRARTIAREREQET